MLLSETIDVSGWTIAFDIDIQKFNLEEGSDEEREVKKAIEQPGDFSISSLFLAFNRK